MSSQDSNNPLISLFSYQGHAILSQFTPPFSVFSRTLLVLLPFITWLLYSGLTNQLADLPGPRISRWTNLRLKHATLRGYRGQYIQALHERYGPIVRISPYEVLVADIAAAKSIYRVGSPFMKSTWYSFFTGETKEPNLFTVTDPHVHANFRRLVAYNFSEKWIRNLEPYIAKTVRLAVERIAGDIKEHGHSDIYKWFTFMATDVVGQSSFGESFRMLETGIKTQYVKDLEEVPVRGMLRAEFPLLMNILYYLPFGSKEVQRSRERIADYSKESIMRYWNLLKTGEENVKPTLLTKAYDAVEDGSMTTSQLEREAIVYLVAGTDTTALSAIYTVWNLACHPEIEAAVIQEVAALPDGFTDDNLRKCKLLNNVLTETLRIRPPIGQSLPRVVPEGGAELCGHHIPAGANVGVQAWSMHRNSTVFKDPERFIPARWDNPSTDMLQSFYTFGGGSRACIEAHFAQLELRHALANFYRTFTKGVTASSARSFSKAEMEVDTYFMTLPKGKRCVIEPKE